MAISVATSLWTPGVRPKVIELNQRFGDLSWGTYGGHHPTRDRATDGMVPRYQTAAGKERGWSVARWIWANRKDLGVWYVIFDAKIISETNPAAGWQPYTPTAAAVARNADSAYHRNHVHVSFYDLPAPVDYLPVYVVDPEKIDTTLTANAPAGKTDQQRPPGFRITTAVRIFTGTDGHQWLETEAGYRYRLDFLVLETEFKKRSPYDAGGVFPPAKPVVNDTGKPEPVVKPPVPEDAPVPANYVTNGLPLTPTTADQFKPAATLDAPGAGNWQGCVTDITTGDRFIAEARKNATGGEDCTFYRFNMAGKYVDSMTAKAAPGVRIHPTGWAVDNSSDIYVTWNEAAPGRNNLVKFPYRSGATVEKKDTLAVAASLPGNLQIALSPTRAFAVVRRIRENADEFTRYKLADLMADKPVAIGATVSVPRNPDRVMQGFTLVDDILYCVTGYTNTTKVLERYSLVTGQPIANYDITHLKGEPEGLDRNLLGMKQGTGDARRLVLYSHAL